jgi:hypothetical protein
LRRNNYLAATLSHCTRGFLAMLRLFENWLARAFAPVFALLHDVPAHAMPRLFPTF